MQNGIEGVKKALYDHWDSNSDYRFVEVAIETPDDAYTVATLSSLMIRDEDHWWGSNTSQLRFLVPWGPEHNAGVFIRNGKVDGFGDL